MSASPLVIVVIVHWGSPELTMACINSVLAGSYSELKIIVVDNCPESRLNWPGGTDPRVLYILNPENTGYCGGNNLGILQARAFPAKHILLLNNDAVIHSDMIVNCVRHMQTHPDTAVISPKIMFQQARNIINQAGGELNPRTGDTSIYGENEEDTGQCDSQRTITFASGCAFFARVRVFEEVGLFDEQLFCYCEDDDLSRRIVLKGYRMTYLPSARVWHHHSNFVGNRGGLPSRFHLYYYWRNKLFNLKRYSLQRVPSGYLKFARGFARAALVFTLKHGRPDLALSMLLGIIDALSGKMGRQDHAFIQTGTSN